MNYLKVRMLIIIFLKLFDQYLAFNIDFKNHFIYCKIKILSC